MPRGKITIIGLTGSVGSGKSTVLKIFSDLGFKSFSTDEIAHRIMANNKIAQKEIITEFGNGIASKNGSIDRSKLADIVFQDVTKRKKLELILHPKIESEIKKEIEKLPAKSVIIIEVPLLFEAGWDKMVNYSIFVKCPREIRKSRFYKSSSAKAGDFERRENAQWSEDKKTHLASYSIDNSKDITQTRQEIKDIINKFSNL